MFNLLRLLLLSLLLISLMHCEEDRTSEDDEDDDDDDDDDSPVDRAKRNLKPGESVMSFSQPSLTEEEQKSQHFPHRYRCEACQIVVHNLGSAFRKAEGKIPKKNKKRTLSDVDVIEITEDICDKTGFDDYSVQEFDGTVTFKGPAFPTRQAAGMSMGGGLWPVRYVNYCGGVLEDMYEDEVYANYRQGNLFRELCLTGHCKGFLKSTPEAVDFKHSLAEDEQLCKAEDATCKDKQKAGTKVEL